MKDAKNVHEKASRSGPSGTSTPDAARPRPRSRGICPDHGRPLLSAARHRRRRAGEVPRLRAGLGRWSALPSIYERSLRLRRGSRRPSAGSATNRRWASSRRRCGGRTRRGGLGRPGHRRLPGPLASRRCSARPRRSRSAERGDDQKKVYDRVQPEIIKVVQGISGEKYPTMKEFASGGIGRPRLQEESARRDRTRNPGRRPGRSRRCSWSNCSSGRTWARARQQRRVGRRVSAGDADRGPRGPRPRH